MGRDEKYPLTITQAMNAADLLSRVNWILANLNIKTFVTSGYRPSEINASVGGSPKSQHMSCKAIDLDDPFGKIGTLLSLRTDMLESCGLWLENPKATPGWIHLDTKKRLSRVFIPN